VETEAIETGFHLIRSNRKSFHDGRKIAVAILE
jgi:hypothetical protein